MRWRMRLLLHNRVLRNSLPKTALLRSRTHDYTTKNEFEPLRILFCGSDEFSIASLMKLYSEHQKSKEVITSIDVVCRPGKPTGRGLKTIREVQIAKVANKLYLPLHQIDNFRAWEPPKPQGLPINLIIAVSFGLFVPRRILGEAKYGGLNVHPSILPDFHGAAPLHHILLSGCKFAGVTVQTLHPKHFDQGKILAQTPAPGWEHKCSTVPELLGQVAPKGSDMLLNCIKDRLYLAGTDIREKVQDDEMTEIARAAPKITPKDRLIDWDTWTAEKILRRHQVIGPLWSSARANRDNNYERRIIWSTGFELCEDVPEVRLPIRQPMVSGYGTPSQSVYIRTCDNQVLRIGRIKIEGGSQADPIQAALQASMNDSITLSKDGSLFRFPLSSKQDVEKLSKATPSTRGVE